MKKYKIVYGETIHDAVAHLKDDDVIYIADPLRMGSPIKEFTSIDAVYKFQQTPASAGYHIFTVPKSEYKSLKKMRNAEFAFNRLHQERKTKSFDSVLKDEEDIIYEVATSTNGGRMDHEYFESKEELLKKYRGKDNGSVVKLDGFLGPFNNGRKNGKRVYRYEDKSTYYSNDAKPQEVLTKRERLKFITELTKALASPQYGYSWDEANDIAIKHADNLGEDWRARWGGDILAEVRQHLKYIKKKMDDSIHDSAFDTLWHKVNEGSATCDHLEALCEELDYLYNHNPKDPQFKKYIKDANTYATNLSKISADILKGLRAFSNLG